jgi:hypothetical protein
MVHQIQIEDETYIALYKLKIKLVELKKGKFIKWDSIIRTIFKLASEDEAKLIEQLNKG